MARIDDFLSPDVVAVQLFEGVFPDAAEVGAAQQHEGHALEGIELQVDLEALSIVARRRAKSSS